MRTATRRHAVWFIAKLLDVNKYYLVGITNLYKSSLSWTYTNLNQTWYGDQYFDTSYANGILGQDKVCIADNICYASQVALMFY
jgi:hypothetical protein